MAVSTGGSATARGRRGERMAAEWYEAGGAVVLCMNYRVAGGEIDLIVRDGDEIAFVEVKARASADFGAPEEAVTPAKQRRICKAALSYAQENDLMDAPLRFDVCAILAGRISVIKNAFDYQE
ncbi:MAG: YraN family protein [Candidatus Fimadaptatus sp.]|jgi:putative endonuclease